MDSRPLVAAFLCAALLWLAHSARAQHAPECQPGGHRMLRSPYRSVDFDSTEIQNTAIQELICDHSLAPAWYRFWINDKPAEMPTSCVEMNRCGTQAPVWLSLREASLPRPGELRRLTACATWQFFHGSAKDCCLFRIPVTVRHCGDFLLYYLQPTQGCMGYCAQAAPDVGARLCPPGEVEVNGRCTAVAPPLSSRPVITPELVGQSVHLRCAFAPPAWSQPLAFQVVWARHIGRSMKAEIRQETTSRSFSAVEMDGIHFRLGETFSCSVSTLRANSSHARSTARESESFYAGLKFTPDLLHIAEDGGEHLVALHSTVPLPCLAHQCAGVHLALSVSDPDGGGGADVALSACQLELRPRSCAHDGAGCGQASFHVAAVTDFSRDGNRASLISVLPVAGAPRLWRNYVPKSLKVTVQDVPTSICYSLTDPHVLTLDGRRYENQQTGTFVFYRSLVRNFEVHGRQWDCGSRHYPVACACGVAAREGNEVAVFDMCDGQPQESRPRLTLKTLGEREGSRVRVLESHQGKKVTLLFPSGAFVRADVGDWGMSVSIRAPSADYTHTRGLCGTFDRNGNNDFHDRDGATFGPDDSQRFIEHWRVAAGESLFDKTPPALPLEGRRPFCHCQATYGASKDADPGMRNIYSSSAHYDCRAFDNMDHTSVFPSMDTTVEYIKSPEPDESILDASAFQSHPLERRHLRSIKDAGPEQDVELREDLLLSVHWPRRDVAFEPVFTAHSQVDLESFAYFFPEDHLAEARPGVQPRWPTPSGLSSAKALEVCQQALANSTVGTACRRLLGRRLDEAVDLCMLDLQLKDDLVWDEALVPYLENECERRLLENRTRGALEMSGLAGTVTEEVVTALRCPDLCNGNGECTEWGCQCFPGYSFYDCSLAISQPVELTDLENGGLCDIRAFNCRTVRVFGLGFISSADLSCHATRLKFVNGAWIPGEKQRTRATFLSSKALDCVVPSLSNMAVSTEDFMVDDKPYARWEIKVTNDGSQYSRPKVLTIYDGVCQVCEASRSGLCKLKERTCNIDGMCFTAGDANPGSPCLLCDPDTSRFTWSVNQVNKPPSFHPPRADLRTFAGENFVFQFAASDPEGSALLFQLEEAPPGAVLSPAGLLIWRVPSLPEAREEEERGGRLRRHSFHFTLSDECNAQSAVTVEIAVQPCGCQSAGQCVTDVHFPAGSGKYLCVCPEGRQGALCDQDVDECVSAPCATGRCINTADGYTCECPPGLRGLTCLEDINECERKPCFQGVQCINNFGSYGCGPCPKGMLGNGTACFVPPTATTSAPHPTIYKGADVLRQPSNPKPNARSSSTFQTGAGVSKTVPEAGPNPSKTTSGSQIPGKCQNQVPRKEETNKKIPALHPDLSQTNQLKKTQGIGSGPPRTNLASLKNATEVTPDHVQGEPPNISNSITKTVNQASGKGVSTSGSDRSLAANVSATCASRPCFPGVQCINRRPPHVGYVCGRCPPGLYGNGRVCMKNAKEASNHLLQQQQQTIIKTGRSLHASGSKVPQLHLPVLPGRSKAPPSSVSRGNRDSVRRQAPASERGGGTGRREALPAPRDGPRTFTTSSGSTVRHSSGPSQRGPPTFTRTSKVFSSGIVVPRGTTSKSEGTLAGAVPSPSTPRHTTLPQLNHLTPSQYRAWTPPRPVRPLTAALSALSYSLSESEFSADGDEAESAPEALAVLHEVAPLGFATPGKSVESVHSGTTAGRHAVTSVTCADHPCFPGVQCEPAEDGGFRCRRCPAGYTGDGVACRAVCRHTCGRNMECAAPNTCRCKPGYTGANCETAICEPACVNGGLCVAPGICQCLQGFHGETCREALCSLPCENGGSCVGPQTCSCPYGFVGPRCETMVCDRHCHNGGHCVSPDKCSCPPGWTGPSCETALCSPVCLNGGSCARPDVCECPHGFYGARCHNAVCSPPCKNGGQCLRNNVCSCVQGYTGRRCEKSVCEPMCMNGGRCVGPDVCDCPSGWQGKTCDKPSCLQKCLNGGECVGANTCHCAPGWQGTLCLIPQCEQKCLYGSRCVRPNVCACRGGFSGSLCSRRLPIT